jgi:hypothetical protein
MGNRPSRVINSDYNATNVVTQVFLDIVQDTSQGISGKQILSVDCNQDKSEFCLKCIKHTKAITDKYPPKTDAQTYIRDFCRPVCECKLNDIKMSNTISVNLKAWQEFNSSEEFNQKILDSISQNAYQTQTGIYQTKDRTSNTQKTVNDLFNSMKSDSFQESLQTLYSQQIIRIKGPSNILHIDFTQFSKYFSTILNTNKETSDNIQKLETNMVQLATQVANAGLAELIKWIVIIVMLMIVLIVLLYAINLTLNIYTIYVT